MRRLRMMTAAATATAVTAGLPLTLATPAAALPKWEPIASYEMSEDAKASVMADSSGNELHGTIASDGTDDERPIQTGLWLGGGNRGYRWWGPVTKETKDPTRVITVADDDRLEPGERDFAVEVRFYTGATWQNLVQKGQSGFTGGVRNSMYKFDISNGRAVCTFHGPGGTRGVSTPVPRSQWHVVRCERTRYVSPTGTQQEDITIILNGVRTRSRGKPTGFMDTRHWPLAVGGKSACASSTVSCDYFIGRMDYVKIEAEPAG